MSRHVDHVQGSAPHSRFQNVARVLDLGAETEGGRDDLGAPGGVLDDLDDLGHVIVVDDLLGFGRILAVRELLSSTTNSLCHRHGHLHQ